MDTLTKYYSKINNKIIEDNLFKDERVITTPQSIEIKTNVWSNIDYKSRSTIEFSDDGDSDLIDY